VQSRNTSQPEAVSAPHVPAPVAHNLFLYICLIAFNCIAVFLFLAYLASTGPFGWDATAYWKAALSLLHGRDPYAEAVAAQQLFHQRTLPYGIERPPLTYIYPPLTLPLLRLVTLLPAWLAASLYGLALAAGMLLQLWAGMRISYPSERRTLLLLLPFAAIFPGLLCNGVILSANLAYVLYGLVYAAAIPGFKHGRWRWYYLAVFCAAIFKPPMLTLLALPILVSRRQWIPSAITAASSLLLFAASARLWPTLFQEYLQAVAIEFEWNHHFGFSPSGMLASALADMGMPYATATTLLYLVFAGILVGVLLYLAHRVRQGRLSRYKWIPVAIVGTILLNPRLKEYDAAAITIPMLLIYWRALRLVFSSVTSSAPSSANSSATSSASVAAEFHAPPAGHSQSRAVLLAASAGFLVFNIIAATVDWHSMQLATILLSLVLGIWSLYQHRSRSFWTSATL